MKVDIVYSSKSKYIKTVAFEMAKWVRTSARNLQVYHDDKPSDLLVICFDNTLFEDKEAHSLFQTGKVDISQGTISWEDLKQGTWYLKEVKAPQGYRLLDHVYMVEVKKDGIYIDGKKAEMKDGRFVFEIQNTKIPVVSTSLVWNAGSYWGWFIFSGLLLGLIFLIQLFRKSS